jgi:HAD superfamily hydrolase (TIGR01509 family)
MTSLISGFILDIDGTLLDSTPAHLKAWQSILHEVGLNKSDAQILQHFGKRTEQIAGDLFQTEVSSKQINYIAEQKTLHFFDEIEKVPLFDQVQEILTMIHAQKGKICFVSNNRSMIVKKIIAAKKWNLISVGGIGTDDVVNEKPHPEMIFKALEMIQTSPSKSVVIGDSFVDIEAGNAAGVKTIAVCTQHSSEEFQKWRPTLILPAISALRPLLPLYL